MSGHEVDPASAEQPSDAEALPLPGFPAELQISATSWHGPLPPPEVLERYDRTVPGLSERLIKLVEDEAEHRRQRERAADRDASDAVRRGQRLGGAVFLLLAAGAAGAAVLGHTGPAIALTAGDVIAGLASVLYPWVRQRAERDERDEE